MKAALHRPGWRRTVSPPPRVPGGGGEGGYSMTKMDPPRRLSLLIYKTSSSTRGSTGEPAQLVMGRLFHVRTSVFQTTFPWNNYYPEPKEEWFFHSCTFLAVTARHRLRSRQCATLNIFMAGTARHRLHQQAWCCMNMMYIVCGI